MASLAELANQDARLAGLPLHAEQPNPLGEAALPPTVVAVTGTCQYTAAYCCGTFALGGTASARSPH